MQTGHPKTKLFQRGNLRGIADYYVSDPQHVTDIEWDEVKDGDVFVIIKHKRYDGYALLRECMRMIRSLAGPSIILVTPQVDEPIPRELVESILSCNRVIRWYTDNWSRAWTHPKLTIFPIGVAGRFASRTDLPDVSELPQKPLQCLANFQHFIAVIPRSGSKSDRLDCIRALNNEPFITWSEQVPIEEYVRSFDHHSFALSPLGTRLDCRRTWEALACGSIPIVKRSTLIPLWRQYPIVVVSDWTEVTSTNLERWKAELTPQFAADLVYRLSLGYWKDIIRSGRRPESPFENWSADDKDFMVRSEAEILVDSSSIHKFFKRNPLWSLARYIWIHLRYRKAVRLDLEATIRHDIGSGWEIAQRYLKHLLRIDTGFRTSK